MTLGSGIAIAGIWAAVAAMTFASPVAGMLGAIMALAATVACMERE